LSGIELALVCAAGSLGAGVRFGVGRIAGSRLSVLGATITVNLGGCFLAGLVTALAPSELLNRVALWGFCGGLTTYSGLALELSLLARRVGLLRSGLIQALAFAAGLIALGAGWLLGRI
jgi:CrcB protein